MDADKVALLDKIWLQIEEEVNRHYKELEKAEDANEVMRLVGRVQGLRKLQHSLKTKLNYTPR